MSSFAKLFICCVSVILFNGCVNLESPNDISSLSQPYKIATLSKNIDCTFDGSLGRGASVTLVAGKYKGLLSDPRGTYWIPDHPAIAGSAGDGVYVRFGGLWIPNDGRTEPRVFYYGFSQRYLITAPTIESALLPWTSVTDDSDETAGLPSLYKIYENAQSNKVLLRPDHKNPPIFFPPSNSASFKEQLQKYISFKN